MNAEFSMTYPERVKGYREYISATHPGYSLRWIIFAAVAVAASLLLIVDAVGTGAQKLDWLALFLGLANGGYALILASRGLDLKAQYDSQVQDRGDWKYSFEIVEDQITVETTKTTSHYKQSDFVASRDVKSFLALRTCFGTLILIPKSQVHQEFLEAVKTQFFVS